MSPKMPNLFIVGAPKCGTTALSNYLAGHPMIFMSEQGGVKEPYFFGVDLKLPDNHFRVTRTIESYLALFAGADETVRYLGEASPGYMYSRAAIPTILREVPSARLIVLLRNPLQIAEALHNDHTKNGLENASFEAAWRLQSARNEGRHLPFRIESGEIFQYGAAGMIGEQLERLLRFASRDQVFISFYEDFAKDPGSVYRALLNWLQLPDDNRGEFPRLNPSVHRHLPYLEKCLQWLKRKRHKLGLPGGLGIHALIDRLNRTERKPLRPEFERELKNYFRQDVELLSQLVGRDLRHWTE